MLVQKTALEVPQECVYLWEKPFEEANVEGPGRGGMADTAHNSQKLEREGHTGPLRHALRYAR